MTEIREESKLGKAFRNVVGGTLAGSLLTTGISMFMSSPGLLSDAVSLRTQFTETASTFAGHMSVWGVAALAGALGWLAGGLFDSPNSKFAPKAVASGLGLGLIAAVFAMPHSRTVYDAVHDALTEKPKAAVTLPGPSLKYLK